MSKKTIFTKAPGLKVMEDMKENKTGAVGTGRVSDAMKRQRERFRDKMRKCVAPGTKKAQAGSAGKGAGGTEARKKRNLSGYSGQTDKISKGKSYKSKMDYELKEKDPKNREVQNRKYVTDMKPGGRNRRSKLLHC